MRDPCNRSHISYANHYCEKMSMVHINTFCINNIFWWHSPTNIKQMVTFSWICITVEQKFFPKGSYSWSAGIYWSVNYLLKPINPPVKLFFFLICLLVVPSSRKHYYSWDWSLVPKRKWNIFLAQNSLKICAYLNRIIL